MDAVVYVDGFNLYHGLRSKYGHAYLWLDLFALAQRMRRHDRVLTVRYFTAIVKEEPEAAQRQEDYLAALTSYRPEVVVSRGRFKKKSAPPCWFCGQVWRCSCDPPRRYRTYEEKLTDVALATAMVEDAATGYGQVSVLVSTDTDFHPAIAASLRVAPDRPVLIACPPGRFKPNHALGAQVSSFLVPERHLAAALLPDEIRSHRGRTYRRPDKWA